MNSIVNKMPVLMTILALAIALAGLTPGVSAQVSPASPISSASLPQTTVRALQQALNAQGIAAPVDGVLDDATRDAIRSYQSQHHLPVTGDPDAATLGKLGVAAPGSALPGDSQAPDQAMGAQGMMDMMTPEMMQMMHRMMAQRGMGQGTMGGLCGQGMSECAMGPGMTGGGDAQGMPRDMMSQGMMDSGPMAMGGGMMGCPMMQMMGARGTMPMMGVPGMPAMLYGMTHGGAREMTPARVRTFLEQRLAWHGNPRLKLGEVARGTDGDIVAEIVTVDGSLVQKLAFNRYPGLLRQLAD